MPHFYSVIAAVASLLALTARGQSPTCFQRPQRKLFRAKFSPCKGEEGLFEVYNVSMSAPFDRRAKRHVLFRNRKVDICIHGKASDTLAEPVAALQNAVRGTPFIIVPLPTPFCEISGDACKDMTPPCGAMDSGTGSKSALVPGQEFCMCSSLEVPSIAPPGINVDVTWATLGLRDPQADVNACERESDSRALLRKGKRKLVCLDIPCLIRNPPGQSLFF